MWKYFTKRFYYTPFIARPNLRVLKLTCMIVVLVVTQVSARLIAQRVTIHQQRITLKQVFDVIHKQTGYNILWSPNQVEGDKALAVDFKDASIDEVLRFCLQGTSLSFMIKEKTVVIRKHIPRRGEGALSGSLSESQNKPIQGRVVDEAGLALPGATVKVKGGSKSTVTNQSGAFTIDAALGQVLVISFLGYSNEEVTIGNVSSLSIVLKEANNELDKVVVTALGIKKESKSLSYNVQQVSGADVNRVTDANFVNNLTGKIAGVTINSASSGVGGAARVVMRGVKSISGNNNALYVVDGVPMPSLRSEQLNDSFSGAGQTGDGISNINPDDIETISVLSGPSAAALYGSAAANGVVLITTKKGQADRTSVNVSSSTLFMRPLVLPDFQNTYGTTEPGSYYSWGEKLSTPSSYNPANFFQTGYNTTNSVSLSTGTQKSQTYVSAGVVNSEGIIHNNNFDRYNFSVRNSSSLLNNKLTMDLGFMVSKVKEQNMTAQGSYFNPLVPLYLFPAGDDFSKVEIYERYDASRNFKTQFWPYGDLGFAAQNPYWIINRDKFINNKNRYMMNANLKYEFAPWINLVGRVKLDQSNDKNEKKFNASTNTLFASDAGYYSLNDLENRQIYGDLVLSINKYLNDNQWSITANAGGSFENVDYGQNMFGGRLQDVPNLFTFNNVAQATAEKSQSGYRTRKRSLFASTQIGYKGLVYLDATARNDWPSTLAGSDTKSFFYPTVGLSGIITDIFKISSDVMPYMKMRVSYSEVGNEPAPHLTIPTYAVSGGTPVTQTRMPNTNLKPELTKSWEGGFNFVFFKNKLKLDATAYKSSTYNQFFEPTLSSSSGYTSVVLNAGQVDNKGFEVSARFNDKYGDFNWGTFVTYALNRNKIIELLPGWTNPINGEVISLSEIDMGGTGSVKTVLKEGGSMGDIYVNTLRVDEHGAIYVHPTDHTVVAEPNKFVFAGNTNPKYNLGWGGNAGWKGLSFNFLFTARVGGTVVSNTQAIMDAFGASQATADARDAGGAMVNGKLIPAMPYYQTIGGGTSGIASMYAYSATNIRLSELSVGYTIPLKKWSNWVKSMDVSLTGRNLFFLYRKAPFDPELTASTGTYYQGIDYFMAPSLRNLGFAVKFQF